eukprot:3442235-Prymnesium_polylepis.3
MEADQAPVGQQPTQLQLRVPQHQLSKAGTSKARQVSAHCAALGVHCGAQWHTSASTSPLPSCDNSTPPAASGTADAPQSCRSRARSTLAIRRAPHRQAARAAPGLHRERSARARLALDGRRVDEQAGAPLRKAASAIARGAPRCPRSPPCPPENAPRVWSWQAEAADPGKALGRG